MSNSVLHISTYYFVALKFTHSFAHTKTMRSIGSYILDEKFPERDRACSQFQPYSDDYIECFINYNSGTAFHGVGSCKMGQRDDMAVVDPKLRYFILFFSTFFHVNS